MAVYEGTGRVAAPMVGREPELADLEAALADARAGRGACWLIAGEPGIGKTRLAEELAARAEAQDAVPHWGRAWDAGGAPSYWPWVQVVRELSRERDDAMLAEDLGTGAPWLAEMVPELRERLPDLSPAPSPEGEQARFSLFDALTTFLRNASRRRPLVLVLDDVHAADQPSLVALEFIARGIADAAILIVATAHEADVRASAQAADTLGRLAQISQRIVLHGLREDDIGQLIERRAGAPPTEALVRTVHTATEGNPFFVAEVVRLLASEQRLSERASERTPLPLPESVRDAIQRRLAPLPETARTALGVAAVIGREFRLATVERVTGIERDQLIAVLDDAVESGVLVERGGTVGRLRFAHGLIRDTLYASLRSSERARLHGQVGEAIEHLYEGDLDAYLPILAHHFTEAAPAGDPIRGVDYLIRAGRDAMELLAYEEAAARFERALGVLELAPDRERHAELLLALGQARVRAGHPDARRTLIEAADAARALADDRLFANAALSLAPFGLSPGMMDATLVALLEEALTRLGDADDALRVRVMTRLAVAVYWKASPDERARAVEEAIAMARRLEDAGALAYALTFGGVAIQGPDTTELALEWAAELLDLASVGEDKELLAVTLSRQVDLLLEADDLPGADIAIGALDRMATELRDARAQLYAPLHRARRAEMEGRFDDAGRFAAEAATIAGSRNDTVINLLVLAHRASALWMQRRLDHLVDDLRRLADELPSMPSWRVALALAYRDQGDLDAARREFDRFALQGFDNFRRDLLWMHSLALLSELCAELQDEAQAPTLYGLLAPFAHRNVVSPSGLFAGSVERYLGLLATVMADFDAASEHLSAARKAALRSGTRPMLAMLAVDEARLALARGDAADREAATERLHEAAALAGELGMNVFAERLRADFELDADAKRPEPAPAPQGPSQAELRREGDVWAFHYAERVLRVRDSKGVRYLAHLLAHPNTEIHAIELSAERAADARVTPAAAAEAGLSSEADDAGPALDAEAKAAYRERLAELSAELEEAESFNDPERATRAREEIDFIGQELSAAVGLGGRDRPTASNAERARVRVTRGVRTAIKRVAEHDSVLGRELDATVRTGTFCVYEPDPRSPLQWRVSDD